MTELLKPEGRVTQRWMEQNEKERVRSLVRNISLISGRKGKGHIYHRDISDNVYVTAYLEHPITRRVVDHYGLREYRVMAEKPLFNKDLSITLEGRQLVEKWNLMDSVVASVEIFRQTFGTVAEYMIDAVSDPDSETETEQEILFQINYSGDQADFRKKFDRFMNEWEDSMAIEIQEKMSIGFHIQ